MSVQKNLYFLPGIFMSGNNVQPSAQPCHYFHRDCCLAQELLPGIIVGAIGDTTGLQVVLVWPHC